MAGYIGNKSQTLVDGYTTTEADAEFVNDPNDVITVNGSNVGIGTTHNDGRIVIKTPNNGSAGNQNGITFLGRDTYNDTAISFKNASGTSTLAQYIVNTDGSIQFVNNSAERMRIDSAGRVTKSNQPMFEATDGSIAGNGDVYWTTIRANVGGHYNSSNGRFTAPVNGYYVFHATCGNSGTYGMDIMKNSGTYRRNEMVNPAGFRWTTVSTVMYLAAGDYVNCWIFTGSASTNQPYAGFSGYLLG